MSARLKEGEASAKAREYLARHLYGLRVSKEQVRESRELGQNVWLRAAARAVAAGRDFSQLPPDRRATIAHALEAKARSKPGPHPDDLLLRNSIICGCVNAVRQCGLPATRRLNRSNAEPSACSIVADALSQLGVRIEERTVTQVWQRVLNSAGRAVDS